jgi:hypothetical protein
MATPTIFAPGLDPTGFTQITGAQLKQLVASAQFASGIGGVIVTVDSGAVPVLPDTTDYPTFENFIWLRVATTYGATVVLYTWNPNATYILSYTGGNVTTNWTPAFTGAIPPQSILGSQIANGTITATQVNIANLLTAMGLTPSSYITTATTPTGGQIGGSYGAGLTLNNNTVTSAEIAVDGVNGIQTANINAKQVTAAKMLGGTINQILATTDGANSAAWVAGNTVGARILQQIVYYDSSILTDTNHLAITSLPQFSAAGTLYGSAGTPGGTSAYPPSNTGLIAPITPKNAASTIRVRACVKLGVSAADWQSLALFVDTSGAKFTGFSASTVAKAATSQYNGPTGIMEITLMYEMTSGQTTEIDFGLRFGGITNTCYTNKDNTKASFFGGSGTGMYGWIELTEYI